MEEIKKTITSVTVNYEDGSKCEMEFFAVVGFSENTWYKISLLPPHYEDRIKMNNHLVDVSNDIVESIGT
ncbi:MAG: hypothetical protein FWC25_00435 [Dehalococcoidia bacterium]|jgi:hypothetical protein|nr:hypothetical protein [Dehalococcoidia bacterium]